MDRPAKVTAQVAPYLAAIRQARAGGWGWREIAKRVAPGATPDAVRAAVKACRYEVEQMPLPEVKAVVAINKEATRATETGANPRPVQTLEIPKKSQFRTGEEIISQASNFQTLS